MKSRLRMFYVFIATSLISLSFSVMIGVGQIAEFEESERVPEKEMQRMFSPDELERMFREEELVYNEAIERIRQENTGKIFLDETKSSVAWISWIPWLFVPLFFRSSALKSFLFPATFPLGLMFLGLFTILELILFILAFSASWIFVKYQNKIGGRKN